MAGMVDLQTPSVAKAISAPVVAAKSSETEAKVVAATPPATPPEPEAKAIRLDAFQGDTPPKRRVSEVTTVPASSTRSRITLQSSRTTASPQTSRDCTNAIVDIDSGFASATAVAKPSTLETRRCLGKELEVFDMADDDECVAPLLSGATTSDQVDDMTTPSSRISRRESTSTFETKTTMSTMADNDDQGDVWAIEDWCSQSSISSHTSPCAAAHTLDKGQREVADAVLSELQIDLQSQVQHALNQMSTWITEEITFASTNFKQDMEQAMELILTSWRKELLEVQTNQSESDEKIQSLHAALEQQVEASHSKEQSRRDDGAMTWRSECLVQNLQTSHAELDCKLKSLQTSLEEQVGSMKRTLEDTSRRIQPSIQTEMQSSHAELDCKMKLLKSSFEEQIESVKMEFDRSLCCTQPCTHHELQNSHAELDCKIKVLQGSLDEQILSVRRLCEDSSHWVQQRTQTESQPSSKVMEARVVAEERKWRLKVDQFQDNLMQHLRRIEALDSQSDHLMRKQAANDIGLEKVSSSIREMDSRLVKSAREEIAAKESLERRIRQIELSNLGGKVAELATLANELLSKSESNEVKLVTDVAQREALEKRVCQMERLNLSEKLAELDTVAKEAARKSDETGAKLAADAESREDLEKRFHKVELMDLAQKIVEVDSLAEDVMDISRSMQEKLAAEVTQQQQLEGFQRSLDEHLKRIDRHDKQNEDLLEKLAVLTLSSEQKSSELERLESTQSATEKDLDDLRTKVDECAEKLEVLESEHDDLSESVTAHSKHVEEQVKGLPIVFRAQLRALEESFNNTIADLKDVFKCSRAELSAHIAEKAWLSDLQCVRDVVQMWVEEARISHQKSVEALATSMEQVQFSSLQQNIEIKKHQEYMKELSKFLNQGLDRDDCVNDVLIHIVEEDYPDLMGVIEKRLRGTSQVPK